MTAANIASGAPWSSAMPIAPSAPERGIYPNKTARPRVPMVFVRLPAIAASGMLHAFLPHPAYTRYDTMPMRRTRRDNHSWIRQESKSKKTENKSDE